MATAKKQDRIYNVRPDTLDFRDKMYVASLFEVPTKIDVEEYKQWKVPILDQGQEGACTGFGLATVVNYLLLRRKVVPDTQAVSARMLYEMARRYDEWPGEDYSGSSARGAMKGWHKHGICSDKCWPYKLTKKEEKGLNDMRTSDATKRPLGAYYRVNHKDIISIHSAMAEVGILFATAGVHEGWNNIDTDGVIPYTDDLLGGHAFAIVGYDHRGFWIQNSWGSKWGNEGFAIITYDDWLVNATDVWVARLGAPVTMQKVNSVSVAHSAGAAKSNAYSFADLRPHIISIGNNGQLHPGGNFGTSTDELNTIFNSDFLRVTKDWKKKRILLYAHGGLVSESAAVQRLADYRTALLQAEVYPVSFIWHSDAWSTFSSVLQDAFRQRKPEGFLDAAKDFMLDRLDDALEPVARILSGKLQWDEMKENAAAATLSKTGAARLALQHIATLAAQPANRIEIHIAGHSAGSIFHALLVQLITTKGVIDSGVLKGTKGFGLKIASCTLWAPACTVGLFKQTYLPAIKARLINRFALFVLNDKTERDDHCARIYNKSLLYLVSNAFEEKIRIPIFLRGNGTPILGMEKFVKADKDLTALFKTNHAELVLAPNNEKPGSANHSTASSHGDFDNDEATVKATLARILGNQNEDNDINFQRSESSLKNTRQQLIQATI